MEPDVMINNYEVAVFKSISHNKNVRLVFWSGPGGNDVKQKLKDR